MLHPDIEVTVDGAPVAAAFFERLVSLAVIDREGIQADTLELEFDDGAPHLQPPRRGARVSVAMGDGAGDGFVGSFVIDRVEYRCAPFTIRVRGHSADLRSEMKTNRTKHWDDIGVAALVAEKAGDYGLKPRISPAVSGHRYDWIGQQDESDLHFLERLARRHGALFTIKNGSLLWLERGTGKTADGTALPVATIPMPSIIAGTCRVSVTDVDRFASVKAYWQDLRGARRQAVVIQADPEAGGEHVLRDPFSSRSEAERAARAAAREIRRGRVETSCAILGRPSLMAGQPLRYAGVRDQVDGQVFILETVKHSFTKSGGLRTAFTGRLRDE